MARKNQKTGKSNSNIRGFLGSGKSVPLRCDLLDCPAYFQLSLMAKAVFPYMALAYYRASKWDTCNAVFIFAYTGELPFSERAFHRAVKEICIAGFFDAPADIQESRAGAPRRYEASIRWKDATINPKIQVQITSRKARANGKRIRRTDYRVKKCSHTKCADMSRTKCADTSGCEKQPPAQNAPIHDPDSGFSPARSAPISISTIQPKSANADDCCTPGALDAILDGFGIVGRDRTEAARILMHIDPSQAADGVRMSLKCANDSNPFLKHLSAWVQLTHGSCRARGIENSDPSGD